jgi:hypothetical protein
VGSRKFKKASKKENNQEFHVFFEELNVVFGEAFHGAWKFI